MSLLKVKAPATGAPASPSLSDSFGSAQNQLHLLFAESVGWVVHHSLQIIVSAVIGTGITLALLGIRTLGVRLCREDGHHWRNIIGRMFARTSFWFCVIIAVRLVDGYADAPPAVDRTINFFFTVISAFQCAIWVREFVLGLIEHRAGADETDESGLGSAIGIIRLLVSLALFAIAAILVLDNLGVNVTGLVAGLGIGGIAIGLAAQGIFADLFAALAIIFDRPFRRGDAISWSSTSGNVEAIGLKSTRIRALTGEQVIIANKKLLDQEIHNFARLDRRRNDILFALDYKTPPDVVAGVADRVKALVTGHEKCALVRCGMTGFGVGGFVFELVFDVRSQVYNEVFDARSTVCAEIVAMLGSETVCFVNSQPK